MSPVAKSHHRPLYRFTLKEPALRSARRGLSATSSRPIAFPPGTGGARPRGTRLAQPGLSRRNQGERAAWNLSGLPAKVAGVPSAPSSSDGVHGRYFVDPKKVNNIAIEPGVFFKVRQQVSACRDLADEIEQRLESEVVQVLRQPAKPSVVDAALRAADLRFRGVWKDAARQARLPRPANRDKRGGPHHHRACHCSSCASAVGN